MSFCPEAEDKVVGLACNVLLDLDSHNRIQILTQAVPSVERYNTRT